MSSQPQLFEPVGVELAALASAHAHKAESHNRVAESLAIRGMWSASDVYARRAVASLMDAAVCESALQFETLAGLVH